jgi:hypothetical protein
VREVFGACTVEEHAVRLQERDDAYWLHVAQKS